MMRALMPVCFGILTMYGGWLCLASPAVPAVDVAEIAKIMINDQARESTEDIYVYYTYRSAGAASDKYVQIPKAQQGDVLNQGDVIETHQPHTMARLEFTAEQVLLLGAGTERNLACAEVMRGESCAMARFEGSRHAKPFWYIKKGAAWAQNVVVHTDHAIMRPLGTEYYVATGPFGTTVVVLEGEVNVRARDQAQEVIVRPGEQTEVVAATRAPTAPVRVGQTRVDDIRNWVKTGVMVIRRPVDGARTEQSSIRVIGAVSDPQTSQVVLRRDRGQVDRIPVVNGEFSSQVGLHAGSNLITVQASTRYGQIAESVSITRVAASPSPVRLPDVLGKTQSAAVRLLARNGFEQIRITQQATGQGRVGTVVAQSPPPQAQVAAASVVDLTVKGAGQDTREAIDRIRQKPHQQMPQPVGQPTVGATGEDVKMTIQNGTGSTLLVHFSGPADHTVSVPDGQSEGIVLLPGRYQVAAEVSAPNVTPFYGQESYQLNVHYQYRFYIQRRLQ